MSQQVSRGSAGEYQADERAGLPGLPQWLSGKESTRNAGDASLIPGLGRSPGVGNGNPPLVRTQEPGGL